MPLPLFLAMLAIVIIAAGATIALAFWVQLPILAIVLVGLTGSLMLGLRQWR
ncbi:MAG: hypothetical protein ACK4VZ_04255 [Paracoccaceae bacterium]